MPSLNRTILELKPLKEASTLLHDESGQTKSFDRFYRDVAKLDATYNRNYLQAEYLYATASAESAARWTEQMQDADDYDLQYRTVGDSRVREEHRALDLVTLPTRHAFWETYYPPNGWRCRCTVIQVRKGKYPTTADAVALEAGQAAISDKNKIFRGNPGREGTVFPENHPYYGEGGYGHCTVASIDLSATDDNEVCDVYRQLAKVRKGEYKKLRKETDKTLRQWAKTHYGQSSINGLQHDMRINNKAVQNFLGHARTIEEKEVLACLIDPNRKKEFTHIATEPLGLHKRMDVKKDADNVEKKGKGA
ncbi:phage head morphogenesis protein, SPP1 gp7 family [Porphyromonas crevioricanis]|uniref:Phage head morphogenesis protein, SPP1 gp7 family n=1 Tax=Porphyromonas crevioricanis TaxID=393921 RepID=A0A2X4PZF7_9PORP|nr:phage (Mu-like) virion morphogenesis protein [Porphyromonas crevioricanis JCM 13913]SQH73699.1 phage head morphogenesis protein, SPP1 gp7 family [Porphyromonas crevioricanis]